eukprot:jgi/Undpi1/7840/HiC_scaffold_23.g10312.m1
MEKSSRTSSLRGAVTTAAAAPAQAAQAPAPAAKDLRGALLSRPQRSVISEAKALELLRQLVGFCNGVVAPRPARDTASVVDGNGVQGKPKTPFERVKDFSNTCAVEKIFGTTCGELPAVPKSLVGENKDDTKHEIAHDYFGTMVLPKEVRDEGWIAKFVAGDGNCAWRALAMGIWGSDVYWAPLKLAVLAWTAANAEELVSEGGILWNCTRYYPQAVMKYARFSSEGDVLSTRQGNIKMVIASVALFGEPKRWGGDLTMLMASQALRLRVKMLVPIDRKSRKQYDAQGAAPFHGTGRKGTNTVDDYRHSRDFLPDEAQLVYRVAGADGGERLIEEVAVVLTHGCQIARQKDLSDIPEVGKDTTLEAGCHFGTFAKRDGTFPPFPVVAVSPPLFQVQDEKFQEAFDDEVAAYNARREATFGSTTAEKVQSAAEKAADMRRQARLDLVAENLRLKQNELADARVREVEKQREEKKEEEERERERERQEGERKGAEAKDGDGGLDGAGGENVGGDGKEAAAEGTEEEGTGLGTGSTEGDGMKGEMEDKSGVEGGAETAAAHGEGTAAGAGEDPGGQPEWFGGSAWVGGSDSDSCRGEAQAAEFDAIQKRKAEARAAAKKHKTRYHRLKKEIHFAQTQQKKRGQDAMYNYVPVVSNLRLELAKGRVAAAQARRKYDRAESAIRRFMRQERKLCVSEGVWHEDGRNNSGAENLSNSDDDSDTQHDWFSDDDLSSCEGESSLYVINVGTRGSVSIPLCQTESLSGALVACAVRLCLSLDRDCSAVQCECDFRVAVAWNTKDPPTITKVHLEHAAACDMDSRASQLEQENLVPVDEIEKRCMGQIRKMTLGGVRPHLIYRCVAEEMKPYKLGPQGARKVRNLSAKVLRGRWASGEDALNLVAELERGPQTVKWDVDADQVLRSIMWASPEQVMLARTYGGVVIQDNTCLTNRYDFKLCLYVGVDSENKTIVFAQGFLGNEQSETFDFANQFFLEICGGHPKVIITDADGAMTSSISTLLPHTKHLYCSWHICKNIKKHCMGALQKAGCTELLRRFTAASYATSTEAFDRVWEGVKQLVKGTACEKYVNEHLYSIRTYWARCFFPTTMTLGMTATQRVEGIFSAIKNGRNLKRNSTFRQVRQRVEQVAEDLALASRMQSTKRASLGKAHVENDIKRSLEPVLTAYEKVGASKYAAEEVLAEMLASSAYETSVLVEGRGSMQLLQNLAARSADDVSGSSDDDMCIDVEGDDVCCQVPEEVFQERGEPDITMFGTTSLVSFYRLVAGVEVDSIVKVLYKHKADRKVGHLVVIGPGGFQLCTCLQILRRGLQCRHVLAALVTHLKRGKEFKGESIHPRWRSSSEHWSLDKAGLGKFDEDGGGSYNGGFTGDWDGPADFGDASTEEAAPDRMLSVIRGRTFANIMELCTRAARKYTDNMTKDTRPGEMGMFSELGRAVDAWARRGESNVSETWSGIRDPPLQLTRNRKQTRTKDCTESGRGSAKRVKKE